MPDAGGNLLGELHFPGSEPNSESLPGLKPDSESLRCVAGSDSQSERPQLPSSASCPAWEEKAPGQGAGGSTPRCTHSWGLGAPRWGARMQPRWGPGRWGAGSREHGAGCLQHPSRELWGWCLPHPAPQSHSCSPLCSQRRRKGVDGVRCCVFSILLLIEMKNARDKGEFRKGHGRRFPFPARERVSQRHC